ncbi:olfactory receptor 1B1 [Chrysemys picta bellii]|uniref:olfactory receptor 1B1 n=1 Tax=Chrysemys picta bellii TaxID=8478 RepID=UPI0032B2B4AD
MGCENGSEISEFILLGLSSRPGPQPFLVLLFLPLYVAGVLGNSLMVAVITVDPRLHSPMYSLLRSLSLVDVGLLSVTVPQALAHALSGHRAVPFHACLAQFFFFYVFGVSDTLLLAAMALDRYVAICDPLRYPAVMSPRVCRRLVASCLGLAVLHSAFHAGLLLRLTYRGGNRLPHFFCDHQPLLRLSCSPTRVNEAAIFFEGGLVILGPFLFIAASYARIGWAVLQRPASERRRALSTCGSHLTMVALFYGAIVGVYFQPGASYSAPRGAVFSVMYTIVTPAANPFVYSLRNKDVQGALRRLMGRVYDQEFWPQAVTAPAPTSGSGKKEAERFDVVPKLKRKRIDTLTANRDAASSRN